MNVRALTLFLACGFTAAQGPLPTNLPRGWERRGDSPKPYDAGSGGPDDAAFLINRDGRRWRGIKI